MTERQEAPVRIPIGQELVAGIQRKFERDTLPQLRKNAKWRAESRRADISTCLPG